MSDHRHSDHVTRDVDRATKPVVVVLFMSLHIKQTHWQFCYVDRTISKY